MVTYIFIFAYLVIFSSVYYYFEEKKEQIKILVVPTFILFLLIDGFRKSSVGGDLNSYVYIFKHNVLELPELSNIFNSRFEIGYIVLNNILSSISNHYTILLFSSAAITLAIWFYVFWKYSQNIYLSLLIYFSSLGMMFYSFSNIRQGLAIAIGLLGFHFFVKEKYVRGILCILMAPLFHTTGIICIFYILLKKIRLTKKVYVISFLGLIITYPLLKSFSEVFLKIFPQYTSYLESSWFLDSYKLAPTILTILYIFVFIVGEIILNKRKLYPTEEYIRILYLCYLLFTIISLQTSLFWRFAYYFSPFVALYIPMCIDKVTNKSIKWILFYATIAICGMYFLVIVYLKPEWYNVVPYRSIIIDWLYGNDV